MGPGTMVHTPAAREVFVVRDPVFDERLRVLGYELLVGTDGADAGAAAGDPARWSAGLFIDAFAEIGLEALTAGRPAWLPVAPEVLTEMAPPVRPDRALLQLTLRSAPDAALTSALRQLAGRGYELVVDGPADLARPLLGIVSGLKIPVAGLALEALRARVADVAGNDLMLVATGVETPEALAQCRALGFEGFQGPFLARPDVVPGRAVPTHRLHELTTMAQLTGGELAFEEVEQLIVRDVGLSHKLLRYANSALFSLPQQVGSVREAMVVLGAKPVQRWAAVLALSGARDQPHELIVTSLIRARMCELLIDDRARRDRSFTAGLFSVVNSLLGVPMREALADLPLADEVKRAILHGEGPEGRVLRAVVAWQMGDFTGVPPESRAEMARAYRDAVQWADEAAAPMPA
jgi:EAL and modified HD-GYP domain-containing signal transduction protein